jgi:hypothetical protein
MNKKRWVQHVSGAGRKFEVTGNMYKNQGDFWTVLYDKDNYQTMLNLPKDEYVICEPLEIWKEVTVECAEVHDDGTLHVENFYAGEQWCWEECYGRKVLVIKRKVKA